MQIIGNNCPCTLDVCALTRKERDIHCGKGEENEEDGRESISSSRITIRLFRATEVADTG